MMDVPVSGAFVYIESQRTGMSLKQADVAERYERTFAELRSAALPVSASRARMEKNSANRPRSGA